MFARIPEPELMDDPLQVDAYASADWSEAHERLIGQITGYFPAESISGLFLNLGCGPGDDTFRFLRHFPGTRVVGVDGATRMIERARDELRGKFPEFLGRVDFHVAYVPSENIPTADYAGVISNSLLHHLHEPAGFWAAVKEHTTPGSKVFVTDLRRPASLEEVDELVAVYAADAPDVLREDFRNSLRAAFTTAEVRAQLAEAGLDGLEVRGIGDRHLVVAGIRC